ncbi:hypothetical protein [Halorhodospira halophila]|nr:hypothetical protein [Halorhodospira halophila]
MVGYGIGRLTVALDPFESDHVHLTPHRFEDDDWGVGLHARF